MSDRQTLRRKIFLGLLTAPIVLFPLTAGASAVIASLAGEGLLLGFGGAVSVLFGLGALATKFLFGREKLAKKALDELQQEAVEEWEEDLDDLDRRLRGDFDPRTEALLRKLRTIAGEIRKDGISERIDPRTRVEISLHVDELFDGCINALEKSLVLWRKSNNVGLTHGKADLLEKREQEIDEVFQCVETLERIYAHGLDPSSEEEGQPGETEESRLARLRGELDRSLEVARRVEARMKSLERSIPDLPESGT